MRKKSARHSASGAAATIELTEAARARFGHAGGRAGVQVADCRADERGAVLQAIADFGGANEHGVSLDTIAQTLGAEYPMAKLRGIVDNLAAEGHLYSTIDDMHFKATT